MKVQIGAKVKRRSEKINGDTHEHGRVASREMEGVVVYIHPRECFAGVLA